MTVSSDNLIEIIKGLIPIVESHIRIGEGMFSNPDPMTMHTPGPWVGNAGIYGATGYRVASTDNPEIAEAERAANARLIAAAPALLAALDNALGNLEAITDRYADILSEGAYAQAVFSVDEARAAIAQATGKDK